MSGSARVVNGYYDEVAALYAAHSESRVGRHEALERKGVLFSEQTLKDILARGKVDGR